MGFKFEPGDFVKHACGDAMARRMQSVCDCVATQAIGIVLDRCSETSFGVTQNFYAVRWVLDGRMSQEPIRMYEIELERDEEAK